MFFLYNLLAWLVLVPYYLVRAAGRGTWASSAGQRLGRLGPHLPETCGRAIWLHAVSVGEVLSCQQLVRQLRNRFPGVKLLVSTTTPAGQEMAREKLGSWVDGVFYAPLDLPFAVRATMRRVRPRLLVVAETEIWPNLFREAKRHGAGLMMVNARISDRSAGRYRLLRFFFRRVLRLPDVILAQSGTDRHRLIQAGAPHDNVQVSGNLKFDVDAGEAPPPQAVKAMLKRLRPEAVVLAGSTREGEEQFVLEAFRRLSAQRLLLILAPRHPRRAGEVAKLLEQAGCPFLRRSAVDLGGTLRLPGVLLVDTLGELASLYRLADVVFVGGSLVNWGGHNVLEPAMAARPIVVGPHMQNFRSITEALLAAEGLLQIQGPEELAPALSRLLEKPGEANALGSNACRFAASHRGAAQRAVEQAVELYHQATPRLPPAWPARALLWLPARLFEAAARARARAPKARRLSTPTVSVGNLTVGGAGKTPMILWLVERLRLRGISIAVLTRGYRRAAPEPVTILEPASTAASDRTGDEAQILLRNTKAPIGISANRHAAGLQIEQRFHPDLILLDDGFQHLQLARDLDIVLLDVTEPFGGGEVLPLGRLREPVAALRRAGAIVLTRCRPGEQWVGLEQVIRRHNHKAPIFHARIEPAALLEAATGQEKSLAGRGVAGFCGIGNPASFREGLETMGLTIIRQFVFRDHHRYSPTQLDRMAAAARRSGAEALVTTEKDLVNLPRGGWPSNLYWLKTRVVIEEAEAEALLQLIPSREKARRR